MAAPLVTFPDSLIASLAILRAGVPGAQFGTIRPEDRPRTSQGLPYVRLVVDSTAVRYPVSRTDFLRVVVWGTSTAGSLALAQTCLAVLMSFPGNSEVRSFGEPVGPTPASDPDAGPLENRASNAGSPFAFFTVAARLRPTL